MIINKNIKFKDACLSTRDIDSFREGCWLTSEAIYFGLQVFEDYQQVYKYLDPSLATLIIFEDDEEQVLEAIQGNNLQSYEYLIIPLNVSQNHKLGSHWVVLICDLQARKFYQLDSSSQQEIHQNALLLGQKILSSISHLKLVVSEEDFTQITELNLQENTFDCGVYALCYCELIAQHLMKYNKLDSIDYRVVTQNYVNQKRIKFQNIIHALQT